jgi:cell wall-associated NlpC family hydrolase
MSAYPYRYRRKGGSVGPAVAVAVFAALLAASGAKEAGHARAAAPAAAEAIAYARGQLGKPYLWGGTGPSAFDCSGLAQQAYAHAGVHIARRSQDQWATERHVSSPRPGDLVFYPGADGTWTAPGHVALIVGHGQMIEAYATGYLIRQVPIRPGMVGYTQPWGGAR